MTSPHPTNSPDRHPPDRSPFDRRRFLQLSGTAAAVTVMGGLLAACGGDGDGGGGSAAAAQETTKSTGPLRKVTLGFIALTDCAPLVMAKELGYFEQRGLDVSLVKQASWPATRDNLLAGQIDGAHCLYSMPYSVATGVSGSGTDLKIAMMLNNNGQAITLSKDLAKAGYGNLAAAKSLLESREPTLAMTYPGGTHDLWLRYWLQATKADRSKVKIIPIPPPQMVANMKVGTMDGYCVGEPWNAQAVAQGIGYTHLATQDLWLHHPEKALVVNPGFAADPNGALTDVMLAVLEAQRWLDDLANRATAAPTIGSANYVNAPAAEIEGRLLGKYDLGAELGSKDFKGKQMLFYRDGKTPFPRKAHGIWAMAQFQRLGLMKDAPPYRKIADSIVLTDLYEKVAAKAGIDIPDDDMAPFEVLLDKTTFDPKAPEKEATRP